MTFTLGKKQTLAGNQVTPNLAQAQRFLTFLDPTEKAFTFQLFEDATLVKETTKPRWTHGRLTDVTHLLVENNNQGCGVGVMVNQGNGNGRSKEHVIKVRAVFIDLDGTALSPVTSSAMPPHLVVETSPGHFHCYWRIHDCPLDQFSAMQEMLATKFGGDPAVKDLPRVMRLPGFIHRKATPFLVRMIP